MYTHIQLAEMVAKLLDRQFSLGGIRFGIDPVLKFIPGFGDLASFFLALYIVWVAQRYQVPKKQIAIMYKNIILDVFLGAIPVVGGIGDVMYQFNMKNLAILKQYASPIVDVPSR